jgi:hypothetical protein
MSDAGRTEYGCVLMQGFYDESGIHADSRVTTIAGWMFGTDHARPCWDEWQKALAAKNLTEFHASDFDHFVKANKWSQTDHDEFLDTLTGILKKYAWFGTCGSVMTSAYNGLPDWLKKRIGGRYHFCFHVLMHQISERMQSIHSRRSPFMVFERTDKVIGRTLDDFAKINQGAYGLGAIVFDTKENVPMLQTADFLVYEINRWLDEQLYAVGNPRVQIRKLAAQGNKRYEFLRSGYHDQETLAALVAGLESDPDHKIWVHKQWWPDSWYPNYGKPKPDEHQKLLRKTLLWNQARRQKPTSRS